MGATAPIRADGQLGHVPAQRYAFEDPGLALDPPVLSNRAGDVAEVEVLSDYALHVRFFDGVSGRVDMRTAIFGENAGVFAELRDPAKFAQVGVGFGAVMWANGLDLAPDAMHDELARNGVWVLR